MEIDLIEKFDAMLEDFDFEKVSKIMKLLNWKWGLERGYDIPEIEEMRESCCDLFDSALESFNKYQEADICSGGFRINIFKNKDILLSFSAVESTYNFEDNMVY